MKNTLALLFAVAALAACSDRQSTADAAAADAPGVDATPTLPDTDGEAAEPVPPAAVPPAVPADTAKLEADYLGRWTGVEGMYLVVDSKPAGGVSLDMQWDLDHQGRFDGSVTAEGLRFTRNGIDETAVHTDGDATGLKHLAGKQDCLTVKPGEGYCRD